MFNGLDKRKKANLICMGILFISIILFQRLGFAETGHGEITWKLDERENAFTLDIANERVTLEAMDADAKSILAEISRQAGIEIEDYAGSRESITTALYDVTLESAIRKIAANSAIIFSRDWGGRSYKISKVVVFPGSEKSAQSYIHDRDMEYDLPGETAFSETQFGFPVSDVDPEPQDSKVSTVIEHKERTGGRMVPNQLIVRFQEDLSQEEIDTLIDESGSSVKAHIEALDTYVLDLPSHLSVEEALDFYRQQEAVSGAEPNYLIPVQDIPNDPDFVKQWSLHNTGQMIGQTAGVIDADIDAPEAWDIEQGSAQVVIAIIDTGVEYNHDDLRPNIWHNPGEIPNDNEDNDGNGYADDIIGWDFVDSVGGASGEDFTLPDNDPVDKHGHGTHVAGIACAVADNGTGIAGLARNCKIMPVRAGYKTPEGEGVLESVAAAQGILYAADNGAKIINLSFGDYRKSNFIEEAMAYATGLGALICAAAGNNSSQDLIYPAASDNAAVLAVGATDNRDHYASFSNWGDWVDVSAPGKNIYSTYLDKSYGFLSGTSMAAPHVSGQAALLFSHFPGITASEVKARIMRSVDVLEDLAGRNHTSGRVNAYAALIADYRMPRIFYLSQGDAHEGDRVTIFGDRFLSKQGNGYVRFDPGINADIVTWSNSVIVCRIPDGAQTGDLRVATDEGTSNGIGITILVTYYHETLTDNGFLGGGSAKGWRADDRSWLFELPFSFPFFGELYESVHVSSNGFLDFENRSSPYLNDREDLKERVMIAPMWDDLITNGASQQGEDIYIHSPSRDAVCIRWAGERFETGDPINAEVILYRDGRIQFNYGPDNREMSPTIGISGGEGDRYHFSSLDGSSNLEHSQTVLFSPPEQSPEVLDTLDPGPATSPTSGGGGGGGCFIATAAYGSPMGSRLQIFRDFRDKYMLTNPIGRILTDFYYRHSPRYASILKKHDTWRMLVRLSLMPILGMSRMALKNGSATALGVAFILGTGMMMAFKGRRLASEWKETGLNYLRMRRARRGFSDGFHPVM